MTKISKDLSLREESTSGVNEAAGLPTPRSVTANKVRKSTAIGHKMDSSVTQDEMQSLLSKLRELVPNIPRNKKLSKLEIIQYVIDYIFDLQLALESHPQSTSCQSNNSSVSQTTATIALRQPLAIKWSS